MATPIPLTMHAAVAYSFEKVACEQRPVPTIGDDEALIRTAACGICSGDVTPYYIDNKAKKAGGSIVLGHEPAGTIVAIAPDAPGGFAVGDRVFAHHHASCMRADCRWCARGHHVQCAVWKPSRLHPGGIAEYVRVEAQALATDTLRLPDSVSMSAAALIEPAACSVKAVGRCGARASDTLVIIGMGIMGVLNLLVARARGVERIICADFIDWRLAKAAALGAAHVVNPKTDGPLSNVVRKLTDGEGAHAVIVGPPSVPAIQDGLACAAKAAIVTVFMATPPADVLPLSPHGLYFPEVTLNTSYSCGPPDTREALRLIEAGAIRAEDVVTHRARIEGIAEAYRFAATPGEHLKTLIEFD